MTLAAYTGGAAGEGSALAAPFFSARSVESSTATATAIDGSTVRAVPLMSERSHSLPTAVQRPSAGTARTNTCNNCGDPIVGRKPEAKFCSTCRCERDTVNESRRGQEAWSRLKADPKKHAQRLEHRRVHEFDRLIDDAEYRGIVNERQRLSQHRRHVDMQLERDCLRCGLRLGVKYVGPKRRLSNRSFHTWCADENRRLRQLVFSQIRRDAREQSRRVAA